LTAQFCVFIEEIWSYDAIFWDFNYVQNVVKILAYSQLIRPKVLKTVILAVVDNSFYIYHGNNIYKTPWPSGSICKTFLEKLIITY
jgi:hypothetical protein